VHLLQAAPNRKLRSQHFAFGMPRQTDARYQFPDGTDHAGEPGVSVLVREAFVVGHADRFKVPLWVTMRWTRDEWYRSEFVRRGSYPRTFKPDLELPEYARAFDSNYTSTGHNRGHMARHQDNSAWGLDSADAGCLMSNIAPQLPKINQQVWLDIEDAHRDIVVDEEIEIVELWVISGCVVNTSDPGELKAGTGIAVPTAFYKVIAWLSVDGVVNARGYLVPHDATERGPEKYLAKIDDIQTQTGLDFLRELPDPQEDQLEAAAHTEIWG